MVGRNLTSDELVEIFFFNFDKKVQDIKFLKVISSYGDVSSRI
jgi:hypothetical protein